VSESNEPSIPSYFLIGPVERALEKTSWYQDIATSISGDNFVKAIHQKPTILNFINFAKNFMESVRNTMLNKLGKKKR
jgi:hypothetical protein